MYKRYDCEYVERTNCTVHYMFTKKQTILERTRNYYVITKTEEEALERLKNFIAKLKEENARDLAEIDKTKKFRYWTTPNDLEWEPKVSNIVNVEYVLSGISIETDFAKESVETAFKQLPITKFQEMWGSTIRIG